MITKVSILIPCFNEDRTVEEIVRRSLSAEVLGLDKEIIAINDGSSDDTLKILEQFIPAIKVISYSENKGKGFAIREAMKEVTGDIILIQDGDLEYHPKDYPLILKPFIDNHANAVFGIRTHEHNFRKVFNPYFWGGRLINVIFNFLTGSRIQDVHVGYKAFKSSLVIPEELTSDGFSFCHELTTLIVRKGFTISQVPISYSPRKLSEGKKIRSHDGVKALLFIVRYFLKRKPDSIIQTALR